METIATIHAAIDGYIRDRNISATYVRSAAANEPDVNATIRELAHEILALARCLHRAVCDHHETELHINAGIQSRELLNELEVPSTADNDPEATISQARVRHEIHTRRVDVLDTELTRATRLWSRTVPW